MPRILNHISILAVILYLYAVLIHLSIDGGAVAASPPPPPARYLLLAQPQLFTRLIPTDARAVTEPVRTGTKPASLSASQPASDASDASDARAHKHKSNQSPSIQQVVNSPTLPVPETKQPNDTQAQTAPTTPTAEPEPLIYLDADTDTEADTSTGPE